MYSFSSTRISRFGSGGVVLRSQTPMDDETLFKAAPSIFATEAHVSRSDKFAYIPTIQVLNGLRKEGFNVHEIRQGGSRDEVKRGFTKHMIRLRQDGAKQVGDSFRELILLNSHDGTSSYQLMSGVFRMVCSNGLVCADGVAHGVKVAHRGNHEEVIGKVVEGAYTVIKDGQVIDESMEVMRSIELKPEEQEIFAMAAAQAKFGEEENPLYARQVNCAQRQADIGSNLWLTFNRVQENLIKGGLRYTGTNAQGIRTNRTTRAVNGIDGNISLNKALWTLTSKMAELKAA